MQMIPYSDEPRTIAEIYEAIKEHFEENPTHGHNCACQDNLIREVRRQLGGYLGWRELQEARGTWKEKARFAIKYVLQAAVRDS